MSRTPNPMPALVIAALVVSACSESTAPPAGSVELSVSEAVMTVGDSLSMAASSASVGRRLTGRQVQSSSNDTTRSSVEGEDMALASQRQDGGPDSKTTARAVALRHDRR